MLKLVGEQPDESFCYSVQNYVEEEFGKRLVYDLFKSEVREVANRSNWPNERKSFSNWYFHDSGMVWRNCIQWGTLFSPIKCRKSHKKGPCKKRPFNAKKVELTT